MRNISCKENVLHTSANFMSHYTHGAFPQADGTTIFSLWAPDAKKIQVKLGDGRSFELKRKPDGWFSTQIKCSAGSGYRYVINEKDAVPDPAARLQHGDAQGLSCVLDHNYPWKNKNWKGLPWHHSVIYELHVGLVGGFRKVEKLLPSLSHLGITAIELMPINEFPGTRNWGYDGVLPFAPEASYGTPDELKSLIDTAHGLGMMVFLDVVYNHFGPDGNYLGLYAKEFFRDDIHTPWGSAIDFRKREVRDFFCENALMWIMDYRFDGLRLDAVHAISEKDFLVELADRVRNAIPHDRHVHLILENEDNTASLLEKGFDAQWNDDGHNILHHLLTNEDHNYYADFADSSTDKLARCLKEGFIFQGETCRNGKKRGEPSAHLPPSSFVLFLQNHDQIGNRAMGERLTQLAEPNALKAATVLLLLSPMIPLLFMGEEWGTQKPFLYFTDHKEELAKAVRDGRHTEFGMHEHSPEQTIRHHFPDPNAISTFLNSRVELPTEIENALSKFTSNHQRWWDFYKQLLILRHREIIPHLPGTHSHKVTILAEKAVCAEWILGNGNYFKIYINISKSAVTTLDAIKNSEIIFSHNLYEMDYREGVIPSLSALVVLACKS